VNEPKAVFVRDQVQDPVVAKYPVFHILNEVGEFAPDVQVLPFETRIFPFDPGATKLGVEVPFPKITLLAVRVVRPVPPPATGTVPMVAVTPE
jgi:hypothetical protein